MQKCKVYNLREIYLNPDDVRCDWIKRLRGTQPEKVKAVRQICIENNVDLFIDIGANYGEFTAATEDVVKHNICFEPNPNVISYLKKSFQNSSNVKIHEKAVGSSNEICNFTIHKKYSGGGRLGDEWSWYDGRYSHLNDSSFYETFKVEKINFFNFLELQEYETVFIKIDTEGTEVEIIESIKDLLKGKKWFILYEKNGNKINFGKEIYNFKTDVLIGNV